MVYVPARARPARVACGGAGVFGTEGAHLGAVALDLGVCCQRREDGQRQAEQGGWRQGLAGWAWAGTLMMIGG